MVAYLLYAPVSIKKHKSTKKEAEWTYAYLGIEETRQPEARRPPIGKPARQLLVPRRKTRKPQPERRGHPGNLVAAVAKHPLSRHSCVVDGVDGRHQVFCHDYLAPNGLEECLRRVGGAMRE